MTPLELYTALSDAYPSSKADAICHVDKSCRKHGYCASSQTHPVLDFDYIKDTYHRERHEITPVSVDAVCIGKKQEHICFVELKGWKNYIANQSKQKKTIEETADGYNLNGKLLDSQTLCRNITGDKDLFAHIPSVFILVTDIDVRKDGIASFHDMMSALAEGMGTEIYSKCASAAQQTLDSEIHIDHDYVFCENFDAHIADL